MNLISFILFYCLLNLIKILIISNSTANANGLLADKLALNFKMEIIR